MDGTHPHYSRSCVNRPVQHSGSVPPVVFNVSSWLTSQNECVSQDPRRTSLIGGTRRSSKAHAPKRMVGSFTQPEKAVYVHFGNFIQGSR